MVDRTAAALQDTGLGKGDRLALLCHNSWQFVVLNFACARAGVVLVPINFMLGADEIAFILDHSGATAFVVEDALLPVAEQALAASQGAVTTRVVVRLGGAEVARRLERPAGLARPRQARRTACSSATTTRCG